MSATRHPGIETRTGPDGTRYRAGRMRVPGGGKTPPGPWRRNLAEAKGDRVRMRDRLDAGVPVRPGATSGPTVRQAWRDFLGRAERGEAWTRSGGEYAPKTLRGYAQAMDDHVLPELGDASIYDVRRSAVQAIVDRVAAQHSGQTARNAVTPLCALYRHLLPRLDDLVGDPTDGLQLPQGSSPRQRVATPAELAQLLDALPARDRCPLALAGLAGLRAGEVRALQVGEVDLEGGRLLVGYGWDAVEGRRALKHRREGEGREVPIFPALVPHLESQLASLGGDPTPSALLVPGTGRWGARIGASRPFSREAWDDRARAAWGWKLHRKTDESARHWERLDGALEPLGLHEARHSWASWLVLAGYDVATIAEWVGHRHVSTTLDRYVKPMRRRGVKPADVHAFLGELA